MSDETSETRSADEPARDGPETGSPTLRRRYTIAELLVGAEHLPGIHEDTRGCLEGPPVGRELG